MKPHRIPLYDFPDVVLHAPEPVVKGHPQYHPAKVGDAVAAEALVGDTISDPAVEQLAALLAIDPWCWSRFTPSNRRE